MPAKFSAPQFARALTQGWRASLTYLEPKVKLYWPNSLILRIRLLTLQLTSTSKNHPLGVTKGQIKNLRYDTNLGSGSRFFGYFQGAVETHDATPNLITGVVG